MGCDFSIFGERETHKLPHWPDGRTLRAPP